ncbi:DUF2075 domain-containing protein [Nibrella saemangeumensis]|uniref:DUF2075 domain-containing protein n=1 Tax=Nibrella saemangeumensis TaxID=1084526 RepID=A0ABP8N5Y7_9BACT
MRLYQGTSRDFLQDNARNQITTKLKKAFFENFRQEPQPAEVLSWYNSLQAISKIVDRAQLYDHGVLLEYQLPLTAKRLDCLICGKDEQDQDNAVIIELKQWQTTTTAAGANEVITWLGGEQREVLHPAAQVGQYRNYLADVHSAFTNTATPIKLHACAYLHNYEYHPQDPLLDNKFDDLNHTFPVFTKAEEHTLEAFLIEKLKKGDGLPILEKIAAGSYSPSKKLFVEVGGILRQKSPYTLLDEQLIVYDKIRSLVQQAATRDRKAAIIVKGGPGTGKSVIALHLLSELLRAGKKAHYATGSKAFTETLWSIFGNKSKTVFKYFNNYGDLDQDALDIIICDEAHRIRATSNSFRTPKDKKSNRPQLYELLKAARVSVYFIDDNQIVRPGEIGSIEYVREYAQSKNVEVFEYELESQFRCNGSNGFVNWVDNTLEIRRTANIIWKTSDLETFDFQIFATPEELDARIRFKVIEGFSARMTAGFCWPWSKPDDQGRLTADIQIGEYKRPWNAHHSANFLADNVPKASLWAYETNGINQVGCVYTAQGFEFDYVGVIFGKDLKYSFEQQSWIGQPHFSQDKTVKRDREHFLSFVRNTYKVLLTRGMKGCYVYFEDKETEQYFRSRTEK